MSIGNTTENDILSLYFTATAIANIADNAASGPLTNIQYSLHTGDPGEAGDQTTNETSYTSYARAAVARTTGGHTVSGGSVSPDANVDFPAGTGTPSPAETVTFFATGSVAITASPPTGKIFWSGSVSPSIVVGDGVTPRLTTATACTLD